MMAGPRTPAEWADHRGHAPPSELTGGGSVRNRDSENDFRSKSRGAPSVVGATRSPRPPRLLLGTRARATGCAGHTDGRISRTHQASWFPRQPRERGNRVSRQIPGRTLSLLVYLSIRGGARAPRASATRKAGWRGHSTFVSRSVWVYESALSVLFVFNVLSNVARTVLKLVDALKHTGDRTRIAPERRTRQRAAGSRTPPPPVARLTCPCLFPCS